MDPGSTLFNVVWYLFFEDLKLALLGLLKLVNSGTHADRLAAPATNYPVGALWFETDRNGIEYQVRLVAKNPTWVYAAGEMRVATLAGLPADLGVNDTGFLAHDIQYEHSYRWTGTVWAFGPEDDHLAGQCTFSANGNAPLGGIWQVCDGSAVPVSQGDGTVANITTPVLSGDTFLMGGGPSAVRGATSPKWDAAAVTDDELLHTHQVTIVSGATGIESSDVTIHDGGGAAIGAAGINHSHNNNAAQTVTSGVGTAHHHKLTNANAVLKPPSIANSGLPQNIGLVFFMRQ